MEHRQQRARVAWRVLATVTTATPPWNVAQPCGGTLYVHSVMLPMLFNLHIHGGGTRQFGRLYPYIHGAAKIPWGGNLPMGRSVKFYLPQNKAIFSHRPMRNSPPHGPITTP